MTTGYRIPVPASLESKNLAWFQTLISGTKNGRGGGSTRFDPPRWFVCVLWEVWGAEPVPVTTGAIFL
jgi:hypothetical protein